MLSERDILCLQREQYRHDQRNHFDILSLPKAERLKHYGLHFSKYVGRLARAQLESKTIEQTVIDTALICLSAANTLNVRLFKFTFAIKNFESQADSFFTIADATGRFADACEKIDHLEEFLSIAQRAVVDIMTWIVIFSYQRDIDIISGIRARRKELADRHFYIEE